MLEEKRVLVTVGVVADTHIPDRARNLHPGLVPAFQTANVDRIFHAGDISSPNVLRDLGKIAPVSAVRGNRDWALRGQLGWIEETEVAGWRVALVHGQGSLWEYLFDKWQFLLNGYLQDRYTSIVQRSAPQAKVIVFGHTHRPVNQWQNGQLLFNPGTAGAVLSSVDAPTIGFLRFYSDQTIVGEVVPLHGYRLKGRQWVSEKSGGSTRTNFFQFRRIS